ncbi:hypothetical protein Dimus_016939 [Dionaea muscipula]
MATISTLLVKPSSSSAKRWNLRSVSPPSSINTNRTGNQLRAEPVGGRRRRRAVISAASRSFDVVVIGAGIIGLSIAREFLLQSDLSVAVVDASLPCSGATGAGQGYLWMAHKTPGTDIWELAMRSQRLWHNLADTVNDPLKELGWKKTGSLLVGRTAKESCQLKKRVQELSAAGVRAQFMSNSELELEEPELAAGQEGCAAFLPDDCQLDAYRTVEFIEKGNRLFESQGRYAEYYQDPAVGLLRSGSQGKVDGVKTKKNTLYGKKAIIVAAGCWTGLLMHKLIEEYDTIVDVPVQPRKGFLIMLENFNSLRLNHGLMEAVYVDHQTISPPSIGFSSGAVDDAQNLSISMTATIDATGNLLIGSSRQFTGFNTDLDTRIIDRIWDHAQQFFPALKQFTVASFREHRKVRIGLRPYMPDGKPVIGPIPSMPNVVLATGHEGSGLGMALGTAEMVVDMVLDRPLKVDHKPFSVASRCC